MPGTLICDYFKLMYGGGYCKLCQIDFLTGEVVRFAHDSHISQIITGYEYDGIGNICIDNGFTRGLPSKTKDGKLFYLSGSEQTYYKFLMTFSYPKQKITLPVL